MLDHISAADFQLRIIRRTTSHYVLTAQKLAVFVASPGGHPNPPGAYQSPDGYPLGRRVREVRAAYRSGRLPKRIVDMYEKIPGWAWTSTTRRPTRSVDDWIDLIAGHTAATGIGTVHEWEKTRDPTPVGRPHRQMAAPGCRRQTVTDAGAAGTTGRRRHHPHPPLAVGARSFRAVREDVAEHDPGQVLAGGARTVAGARGAHTTGSM